MTGFLDLRPGGPLAPIISAFMKPLMPEVCREFAETLARKVEEAARAGQA